jgi:hypothetical protein
MKPVSALPASVAHIKNELDDVKAHLAALTAVGGGILEYGAFL